MAKAVRSAPVPIDQIGHSILILRGQWVILDREPRRSTVPPPNASTSRSSATATASRRISCSSSPPKRQRVQGRNLRP